MKEILVWLFISLDLGGATYLGLELSGRLDHAKASATNVTELEAWYERAYDVEDQLRPEYASRRNMAYKIVIMRGERFRVYEDNSLVRHNN